MGGKPQDFVILELDIVKVIKQGWFFLEGGEGEFGCFVYV